MAVLRWRYCQSRWRVLFCSVAQSFLHTDFPLCLKMDSLRKMKVFFNSTSFCNVSPAAHAQMPHTLKRMQMTGHSSRCKNKLVMNGKHVFLRGCFDLQCVRVCVLWLHNDTKDTLLLILGQLLYLARVAWHLLRHHKQQVGVVYPLGVNQPVERDDSVSSTLPLLADITRLFVNGWMRFTSILWGLI